MIIGECLFTEPYLSDTNYDKYRDNYHKQAEKYITILIRTAINLTEIPQTVKNVLNYHESAMKIYKQLDEE